MEGVGDTHKALWWWLAVVLYCGLIFALSSIPGDSGGGPGFPWNLDKLAHGLEYALLGYLLARALQGQLPGSSRLRLGVIAWLCASAYGAGDEWHQSFVPGRSPSLMDLLADVVGAATSIAMSVYVAHRKSKRLPPVEPISS